MIFKVTKWNKEQDYHECIDVHGRRHFFDLIVANCSNYAAQEMVGKSFEASDHRIKPYISIVNDFWEIKDNTINPEPKAGE